VALFGPVAQTQVDGILLQSLASGPLTRPVMDAVAAGIPVVAIDAPPPNGSGVTLFVTANTVGPGAQMAEKVLALVPADAVGSVLIGRTGFNLPSGGVDLKAGNLKAVKDGHVDCIMSPGHGLAGCIATRPLANAKETGAPLVPGGLVSASTPRAGWMSAHAKGSTISFARPP